MLREIVAKILIKVSSEDEKKELGDKIHGQLIDNEDYINSNIVLDLDGFNLVTLYVYKECTTNIFKLLGD